MTKKYDVLIFIGRFQPFHYGHKRVVDRAMELSKHVIVLAGSANRDRSQRNMFHFHERKEMIESVYPNNDQLNVMPLDDVMYNDERWVEGVQRTVKDSVLKIINKGSPNVHLSGMNDVKVGLIGCMKDGSSYYLKLFPTWESEDVFFLDPINATDIRNDFIKQGPEWKEYVPNSVETWLNEFQLTEDFMGLHWEADFVSNYQYNVGKYPRIEQTVDAVVVQSGHVLLIRRRAEPGMGKWAMPGGFLNQYETQLDGALRELEEETKIKVPPAVLRGSIVASETYDDPHRSDRGRLITKAFLIKLPDQTELPKVKGSDDADKAKWVALSELRPMDLFEDHYWIIMNLIDRI